MATFSVMRALTQGKTHVYKHLSRVTVPRLKLDPLLHRNSSGLLITFHLQSFRSVNTSPFPHRFDRSDTNGCPLPSKVFPAFQHCVYFSTSEGVNRPSSEEDNVESSSEGKSEGDKKAKDSWWRGKNSWRLGLIFLSGACIAWGVGLVSIWGEPQLDPDGNEIQDEYSELPTFQAYLKRTWKEMKIFKQKIQEPSREKLLPEPLSYPYMQPPYTLVLEMTGVLIHPDWTYSTGWRFKKRPGIEYFLSQVGPPLFEVVIYSSEVGMTADPLVNNIDPQGYVMYRLYRDATRYMDGHHVKDLSCLNRDLSRVIMLDCNQDSVKLSPRNSLVLKKWAGKDGDRTLIDLAHFLKTIGTSGVEDVRPVIDYYSQFEDPLTAFRENQRKLQEEEEARAKFLEEENKKKSWFSGFKKK